MELHYLVDRPDIAALVKFNLLSHAMPEKTIAGRVIAAALAGGFSFWFLDSVSGHELRLFAAGVSAVVGGLMFAAVPRLAAIGQMRDGMVTPFLDHFVTQLGSHTFQAGEERFTRTGPDGQYDHAWSALERVGLSGQYVFLIASKLEAHVVPLLNIGRAEERDTFVRFVKDHVNPEVLEAVD